jgi:hypothetical protein
MKKAGLGQVDLPFLETASWTIERTLGGRCGCEDCAQFCAHHQTRPSVMACCCLTGKPCWTSHLWHFVAIRSDRPKSLILCAAMATNQKVGSPNLSGRAILPSFFAHPLTHLGTSLSNTGQQ